jgi:hypothetical protein
MTEEINELPRIVYAKFCITGEFFTNKLRWIINIKEDFEGFLTITRNFIPPPTPEQLLGIINETYKIDGNTSDGIYLTNDDGTDDRLFYYRRNIENELNKEENKDLINNIIEEFDFGEGLVFFTDNAWIDRNGTYYDATEGSDQWRGHRNCEDKLSEIGIIPKEIINCGSYLEELGWLKLTNGYIFNHYSKRNLSKKQKDFLFDYICEFKENKSFKFNEVSFNSYKDFLESLRGDYLYD